MQSFANKKKNILSVLLFCLNFKIDLKDNLILHHERDGLSIVKTFCELK